MEKKGDKKAWLADFYETAAQSIGLPAGEDSESVHMFRMVLQEYIDLCRMHMEIERRADCYLRSNPDCQRLQTIPGRGLFIGQEITIK